jgi:serine/threonine protein phosphatase PrpC
MRGGFAPPHMSPELKISAGQYSDKGRKETNQDFHGIYVPVEPQLSAKGIAIALADGISSSAVSDVASQYAVTGFLKTITAPRNPGRSRPRPSGC